MNKLLTEFASRTSAHGWGTIPQGGSKCGKTIWILFTIACQFAAIVWVGIILTKYTQYKTKDRIHVTSEPAVQFPSVTVCPLNQLPESDVEQWLIDYMTPGSELAKINNYNAVLQKLNGYSVNEHEKTSVDEAWERLVSKYNLLNSYPGYLANNPFIWNYGHDLHNLIPGCMYKKEQCKNGSFEKLYTSFQNCFTYNGASMHRHATNLYVTTQGMQGGLTLIIFLDMSEISRTVYNPYHANSGSSGARVIIHDQGTLPDPDNDGFNTEPGHSFDIGLSVNRRDLMQEPWGNCKNQSSLGFGEYKYSKNACRQQCRANLIYIDCGCVHETLPMLNVTLPNDDVFCAKIHFEEWLEIKPNISTLRNDLDRLECMERYLNYTWQEVSEKQGCDCPENCITHSYNIETSQAVWPIKGSEQGFYCRQLMELNPKYINSTIYKRFHERASDCYNRSKMMDITNDIGDEFSHNFIRLNIYFKDLDTRVTIQDQDFSFWSMICEIGGILGFFIGVSVISIAEFMLLCFNVLYYVTFKKSKVETTKSKNSGNDDIQTEKY